ncbi:hypothetical protein RFI_06128 [Reticulomyxa filosa]|uniref:Uncharacterized protein n=1 Tax=Reticulomyxa filosa TaxID=46433 RepID=X6NXF8_RETFI|nr:hypothetical protein RFI_06128 [Reticulomyxa filosa]|eukprot:ETO30990.1 hypothetical protein RFI_06128 [Reticulomyxa filosa]
MHDINIDKQIKKNKQKQYRIEIIINNWLKLSCIQKRWAQDINNIIISYYVSFIFLSIFTIINFFKQLRDITTHLKPVTSISFSADGTRFVSSSDDKTVRIWDISSENEIEIFKGHTQWIGNAIFSPKGTLVASCSGDKTIQLWDVGLGTQFKHLEGHSDCVTKVCFSQDGKILLSCSWDKTIRLWKVKSGKILKVLSGHSNFVNDVQFSPDCETIVSASDDNTIGIWSVNSGDRIAELTGHLDAVKKVNFSYNGRRQVKILNGHLKQVCDVKFSPDDQLIISCSADTTIRIWDIKLEEELQQLNGHSHCVTGIDISPDGNKICGVQNSYVSQFCEYIDRCYYLFNLTNDVFLLFFFFETNIALKKILKQDQDRI